MKITLPVSQREMEIPAVNYREGKELRALQRKALFMGGVSSDNLEEAQEIIGRREKIMEGLLENAIPDLDDLPSRDVLTLISVTYAYAMGEPVAAIKNLLAGGDGAPTNSEPNTVPTATVH